MSEPITRADVALNVMTSVTVFKSGAVSVSVVAPEGAIQSDVATDLAEANAEMVAGGDVRLTDMDVSPIHGSDVYHFRGRKPTAT